jgi:protein TonB
MRTTNPDAMHTAMQTNTRDRLIGALGSAAVIALLGYALLAGLLVRTERIGERSPPLLVLDLPRPKPPPLRPVVRPQRNAARRQPSPRNLKNTATELVAPRPAVVLPVAPPVITAVKPQQGLAPATGASALAGAGEGAGGRGQGTGGGGSGEGDGDRPPRQIAGRLKISDLPISFREGGIGGTVVVRYDVGIDGMVSGCAVSGSSGNAELDRLTCHLIEERFRFKPSRDSDGRPVPSTIEDDVHIWEVPKPGDPAQRR